MSFNQVTPHTMLKDKFKEIIEKAEGISSEGILLSASERCEQLTIEMMEKFGVFCMDYEVGSIDINGVKKYRLKGSGVYATCYSIDTLRAKFHQVPK